MFNDFEYYKPKLKKEVAEFSRKDNKLIYKVEIVEEKIYGMPEKQKLWNIEVKDRLYVTDEKLYYWIIEETQSKEIILLKIEGMRSKSDEEKGNIYHLIIEAKIPLIDFKGVYHTSGFSLPLEKDTFYLNKAVIDSNTAKFDLIIGNYIYKIKANRRPCYSCGITNLWEVTYEHIKRMKR